jgi:hypothetical protein
MSEDKQKKPEVDCSDCPPDHVPDFDLNDASQKLRRDCGRAYNPNAVAPIDPSQSVVEPEPVDEEQPIENEAPAKKKFFGK